MNRGGIIGSATGAIILAAVLLRGPATVQNSVPGTARATSKSAVEHKNRNKAAGNKGRYFPEDGPWKASQQHFAGTAPEPCPARTPRSGLQKTVASSGSAKLLLEEDGEEIPIENPRSEIWCIPDGEPVEVLIATVPNPAHTRMALMFDRAVEALQLAAQSMNYVADQYWLPWETEAQPEWKDYDSQQQAAKDEEQKEAQPGVLMFRWNGERNKPMPSVLYVFLVAETSTSGLNGAQFNNAVDYIHDVCSMNSTFHMTCNPNDIHIIGPTFSGSLESLRRLTKNRREQLSKDYRQQIFTAYSGTVSSICAQITQGVSGESSSFCDAQPKLLENLKFKSFVTDTESAVDEFMKLLHANHDINCGNDPEVAILSEAATTYGSTTAPKLTLPKLNVGSTSDKRCFTSFSYPREIAALRNAYNKPGAEGGASGNQKKDMTSVYLPFNLSDDANSRDEPPDYSRQQGPIAKEAVLMEFAAELRRDHYKYIGITGTNVLDILFLVSFLRSACPDARLFVFNSDLLFEREIDNAPFIGTLAITTYPLVPRNLDWTLGNPGTWLGRLPFADHYEEGGYNASLATLKEMLCGEERDLYEAAAPFHHEGDKLPLWLTVVGTGGYWPVQLLHPSSSGTAQKPELNKQDFSPAWKAMLTLLCGFGVLHMMLLLSASPLGMRFRDLSLLTAAPAQRLFFIHLASASLALAIAMLVVPAWRFGNQGGFFVEILKGSAPAIGIGLLCTCAGLHLNYFLRRRWELKSGKDGERIGNAVAEKLLGMLAWRNIHPDETAFKESINLGVPALAAFIIWIATGIFAWGWFNLFSANTYYYGFFFAYRTVHLATGVSPFMPVLPLLAAIYLWSIFEMWRLRFNDRMRPRIKGTEHMPGSAMEQEVANSVKNYLLRPRYAIAFLLVYGIWFLLIDFRHPFELFEQRGFGTIYELLFFIVVALMLSSGFRLGQLWSELHAILIDLERSPIRVAFDRLKGFSWSPIWRQGGDDAEWNYMSRSLHTMQQTRNWNSAPVDAKEEKLELPKECRDQIENVEKTVTELKTALAGLQRDEFKQSLVPVTARVHAEYREYFRSGKAAPESFAELYYELQSRLSELQGSLADVLNSFWKILKDRWEKGQIHLDEDEEPEKNEQPVCVCQTEELTIAQEQVRRMGEFVALRYVAFIRCTLGHIRHMLMYCAISFSLVLISLNVYSFEPHQTLIWSFTAIFFVIGSITVAVLMQIHRDPILSRVTDTKANELGAEFYMRILSLGAVPVLTLLATHFPSIGRGLLSLFQPGLEALK
jgi:hypothetical protein